jgi:copper/silver efflux system protein
MHNRIMMTNKSPNRKPSGLTAERSELPWQFMDRALELRLQRSADRNSEVLDGAIREGAVLRVRPKAMTVAVILAGLLPIVWGSGTSSEVMSRIAAPMLGDCTAALVVCAACCIQTNERRETQSDRLRNSSTRGRRWEDRC